MKNVINAIIALVIVVAAVYLYAHRVSAPTVPTDTATTTGAAATTTATDVSDDGTPVPHINSVSPNKARIGDKVEIRGVHFSGFEGDKYAWIENAQGEQAIIHGDTLKAADGYIAFTLESRYCTKDTSYSGLDCPSYLNIVPGAYKIFVLPWGTKSNEADFTVIK
jgi:hypothetical protein